MSWQELVDKNLVGTGKVSKAAICGFDGTIWGKSTDLNITPDESSAAARAFQNPDACRGTGLKFEGEKYFVLNVDDERIIGKKGSFGFFIYKTNQCQLDGNSGFINRAVIIALYREGVQPEQCSKTAGALADYFKGIGY